MHPLEFNYFSGFFFFWLSSMWDLSYPIKDELGPLNWKHGVLTIRPSGKPLHFIFKLPRLPWGSS